MSDSRYAPPATAVADFEPEAGSLERPRNVTIGIRLLWISLAAGIPGIMLSTYAIFDLPATDDPDRVDFWVEFGALAAAYLFTGLAAFLTHRSWQGRNWARIVTLVLMIVGTLMGLIGLVVGYFLLEDVPNEWTWEDAVYASTTLLDVVAMCLLFTPASNTWYRAMKQAR
jgi:uncharacterized membrane protein YfcA